MLFDDQIFDSLHDELRTLAQQFGEHVDRFCAAAGILVAADRFAERSAKFKKNLIKF